ncbi:hypothetical protein O181_017821 [Austropuccinia psidii MF-1]|uniref:Uncharacterized protein n=1 Tax=Austropuccinia psidii MF-1 TaxID=1389203 RepID=A0A9Q3GSC2_9BASI|nr:hypothetical protein [Austropuccinia psidii MF-1]
MPTSGQLIDADATRDHPPAQQPTLDTPNSQIVAQVTSSHDPVSTSTTELQPTGSRFIEEIVTNDLVSQLVASQDQIEQVTQEERPDSLISLLHNDLAPPLAPDEFASQDSDSLLQNALLPSVLFAIPFPAPVNANRSKNSPPFLIYSPPRSTYQKPIKNAEGKRGKEKIIKKVVRKWQEEVEMGEEIKRGKFPNPTRFKKVRGGLIRAASGITKWLPSSCVETLSRLPPRKKFGQVTIIHPMFSPLESNIGDDGVDRPYQPTEEELLNDLGVLLRKTRKRLLKRAILAGMLLPISLGIDVFAPVFAFEINVTYFAFQIYGLSKAKLLLSPRKLPKSKRNRKSKKSKRTDVPKESTPLLNNNNAPSIAERPAILPLQEMGMISIDPPSLDPVMILLYQICSKIDPISFPPLSPTPEPSVTLPEEASPAASGTSLPLSLKKPGSEVVREMIRIFKATLPEEVADRYLLDEERLSEDLARYFKKASTEYIDSLSGRSDRKGLLFRIKTWKKTSATKSQIKKAEAKEKKMEKKRAKEAETQAAASELEVRPSGEESQVA